MNKQSLLALEVIWIVAGILSTAAGIRYAIITGGDRVYIFILMALVSFAFAWVRHRQRKKS